MNRLLLLAIVMSIVILPTGAYASGIPDWVKTAMGWYSDDRITDGEFMETLQFLIDEGILNVPQQTQQIIYRDVEIIKEVQAQEADLTAVWEAINFNAEEIRMTVKFNPTADLYSRFNDIENQIREAKDQSHDNEKRIEILNTPVDNPSNYEYERKYNELLEMYIDMGQRVVDLEREHLD